MVVIEKMNIAQKRLERLQKALRLSQAEGDDHDVKPTDSKRTKLEISETRTTSKSAGNDSKMQKYAGTKLTKAKKCSENPNINDPQRSTMSEPSPNKKNTTSSDISNSTKKKVSKVGGNEVESLKIDAGSKKIKALKTSPNPEKTKKTPAADRLARLQKTLQMTKRRISTQNKKKSGPREKGAGPSTSSHTANDSFIDKLTTAFKERKAKAKSKSTEKPRSLFSVNLLLKKTLSDKGSTMSSKKKEVYKTEGSQSHENPVSKSQIALKRCLNMGIENSSQKNIRTEKDNQKDTNIRNIYCEEEKTKAPELLRIAELNAKKVHVTEGKLKSKNTTNTNVIRPKATNELERGLDAVKTLEDNFKIPKKRSFVTSFQEAVERNVAIPPIIRNIHIPPQSSTEEPLLKSTQRYMHIDETAKKTKSFYRESVDERLQNNEEFLKLPPDKSLELSPKINLNSIPCPSLFDKDSNTCTGFPLNSRENLFNVNKSPNTFTPSIVHRINSRNSIIEKAKGDLEILIGAVKHKNSSPPNNDEYKFQRQKKNLANERMKQLKDKLKNEQKLKQTHVSNIDIKTIVDDSKMHTKQIEQFSSLQNYVPTVDYEPMDVDETPEVEDAEMSSDTYDIVSENLLKLSSIKTPSTLSFTKDKFCIVLDTNILLHKLNCAADLTKVEIPAMGRPVVVIPYCVLQELDTLKHSEQPVKLLAIKAINYLNMQFKDRCQLVKGQSAIEDRKRLIYIKSADDCIINCCLQIKDASKRLILITYDNNLKNKAISNDVQCCSPEELTEF